MVEAQDSPEGQQLQRGWYAVSGKTAHFGAGSSVTHINYVFAHNALEAMRQAKHLRGWGRHKIPQVIRLNPAQSQALEELLEEHGEEWRVNLKQAKKDGVLGTRGDYRRGQDPIFVSDLIEDKLSQQPS